MQGSEYRLQNNMIDSIHKTDQTEQTMIQDHKHYQYKQDQYKTTLNKDFKEWLPAWLAYLQIITKMNSKVLFYQLFKQQQVHKGNGIRSKENAVKYANLQH